MPSVFTTNSSENFELVLKALTKTILSTLTVINIKIICLFVLWWVIYFSSFFNFNSRKYLPLYRCRISITNRDYIRRLKPAGYSTLYSTSDLMNWSVNTFVNREMYTGINRPDSFTSQHRKYWINIIYHFTTKKHNPTPSEDAVARLDADKRENTKAISRFWLMFRGIGNLNSDC